MALYKALAPITLYRDYRPGDTFEAEPAEVEGKDVLDLGGPGTSNAPSAPTGAISVRPEPVEGRPEPVEAVRPEPVEGSANEAGRIAAIVAAIGRLDKADAALWTNAGAPKTDGLAAITGWPLSAAERDTAWAALQG